MAPLSDPQDTFLHLVENTPFGVFFVDADLKLVQVSEGARRTFRKVTPLLERELGEVLATRQWPESMVRDMVAQFRRTLENGEAYRSPRTVVTRVDTGQVEHYDWRIERVTLPDGRNGVVCLFYDLTDRHRTVSALRRIKDRFRMALDAAGAFVYELDPIGAGEVITYGMDRVTGYRVGEDNHTVAWWLSLIHPEDLPEQMKSFASQLEKGGARTAVYRIRHKDGTWIWVESSSQVLKDASGQPTKIVGAMVDITQRKQANDALFESESRLRALHAMSSRLSGARELNGALDDLLATAIDACGAQFGNVQLFNPQLRGLEIVAHRGFRQPYLDHFRVVRVDDGSATARVLKSGEQLVIEDVQLDAEFTPHRDIASQSGYRGVVSTPLKTYDGSILGILTTHFRQPHRVSGPELQLLELYARYAAALVVRLRHEKMLQDAERRKDEFIATLAHELRGPLAPVVNSLEMLKWVNGDDRVEKARSIMNRQVTHLRRLVDDLLDITRIVNNKLKLHMEDVELTTVMRHVVETCDPVVESSGHRLKLDIPGEIQVHADPLRLVQVLVNLVTNASKYMDRGGTISISARLEGSEVEIVVSDTGFGIAPESLPGIFDLFMQVDTASHKSGGGLGIGLPLVKRLVELHGGTVTAHSEGVGRGSRFILRLPVTNESVEAGLSMTAR
ncbi:hypothetical protein GCM10027034_37240 [Ramlibacter solisilvae]|uniref:sensor histidine kinase n=1 Tax=Ramlibacter tataouinensis TaxID=94132 RepID=UPI0007772A9D|nr:ATP-binding protein [Ramlibacter tataouinensis]